MVEAGQQCGGSTLDPCSHIYKANHLNRSYKALLFCLFFSSIEFLGLQGVKGSRASSIVGISLQSYFWSTGSVDIWLPTNCARAHHQERRDPKFAEVNILKGKYVHCFCWTVAAILKMFISWLRNCGISGFLVPPFSLNLGLLSLPSVIWDNKTDILPHCWLYNTLHPTNIYSGVNFWLKFGDSCPISFVSSPPFPFSSCIISLMAIVRPLGRGQYSLWFKLLCAWMVAI